MTDPAITPQSALPDGGIVYAGCLGRGMVNNAPAQTTKRDGTLADISPPMVGETEILFVLYGNCAFDYLNPKRRRKTQRHMRVFGAFDTFRSRYSRFKTEAPISMIPQDQDHRHREHLQSDYRTAGQPALVKR